MEHAKITVAATGLSGNMGTATTWQLLKLDFVGTIRALLLPDDKRTRRFEKTFREYIKSGKIAVTYGKLQKRENCGDLLDGFVKGADYVLHIAAVIPPLSDQKPELAVECNEWGTDALVTSIENAVPQPKLVHISTMALYGNRNEKHIWGRVGDPLTISPYDVYAVTKLRGEFRVLESKVKNLAVIRQTAMLHLNMLADNMSDGLMFHTAYNAPLEWATAHDSGLLLANILRRDVKGELGAEFWGQCFNLSSLKDNQLTGFDVLNDGFKLIGGTAKDFFKPQYNAHRNFHGVWFADGNRLQDLFDYHRQTTHDYWREIAETHRYYALAKIVPKKLIAALAINPLRDNPNAPKYWADNGDEARLTAYFGGKKQYEALDVKWEDFPLLVEGKLPDGSPCDLKELHTFRPEKLLDIGYDDQKADSEIDIEDMRSVAAAHGGKLLTETVVKGDLYTPVEWETQDGERFWARPFTVLRAGHWYNPVYREFIWDFDRLSKKDRVFAASWYDSHETDEDNVYAMDEDFNAYIK